jgi:molecular chaperone GrpE
MSEKTEESTVCPVQTGEAQEAEAQTEENALRGEEDSREAKIAELEAENAALKDQVLRTRADADNFRKRLLREKQEAIQFANKQLLLDLLPVLDDFERAIKSGEGSQDFAAFRDGVVIIEKHLTDLLDRKWGLKRFVSVGEEFDPQRHEAVFSEEAPGQAASVVLEDYMKGYTLHDKVVRAAKVKISLPAPAAPSGPEQAPQESCPQANTNAEAESGESPGDAG